MTSTSCENLTPGENAAVFGTGAGLATGIPLAAAGVDSRIAVPAALGAAALAAGVSYVIAKHQATERQRKIAEQRARIYMAQRAAAQQREARTASTSRGTGAKKNQTAQGDPLYRSNNAKRVLQQGAVGRDDLRYAKQPDSGQQCL